MSETKFTEDHEWILMEDDEVGVVGITDYAQDQLGELVFVELPEVGTDWERGAEVAVIESVKAAGDVKAPVGGTVVGVNEALVDEPEKVNADPAGEGWIVRIRVSDPSELETLMDAEQYEAYIGTL
jgi:glycine cleavage system H protein